MVTEPSLAADIPDNSCHLDVNYLEHKRKGVNTDPDRTQLKYIEEILSPLKPPQRIWVRRNVPREHQNLETSLSVDAYEYPLITEKGRKDMKNGKNNGSVIR